MTWKRIAGIVALTSLQACTVMGSAPYQSEDQKSSLYLQADSEALKSFFEGVNGAAQVAKDSPDKKGSYWAQREHDSNVRALRFRFKTREEAK